MKRILISIDGGGIRGIIPLVILREIAQHSPTPFNTFQTQWWGTSTGSIISGALCTLKHLPFEVAVQKVLDLYELRSARAINPGKVSQPERAFNQLITANFKDLRIGDYPQFHCVAADVESGAPVIIDHTWQVGLDDAIRASCAFPGLFPPVELLNRSYMDGYVHAKNPTQLAMQRYQSKGHLPDLILSLGTGIMRQQDAIEVRVGQIEEWAEKFANAASIPYFRINPPLVFASDNMQNITPKNVHQLKQDAFQFLEDSPEFLQSIIAALS
jgi:hypothetical protein